jgi:hypothetical protein
MNLETDSIATQASSSHKKKEAEHPLILEIVPEDS